MAIAKICRYCKEPYPWNGDREYEYICSKCTMEYRQLKLWADRTAHELDKVLDGHTEPKG